MADPDKLISSLMNQNGFTPVEAQGRMTKARQLAVRHGLLLRYPELMHPQEREANRAALEHAARQRQWAERLERRRQAEMYAEAMMAEIYADMAAARANRYRREQEERANAVRALGLFLTLMLLATGLMLLTQGLHGWLVPLAGAPLVYALMLYVARRLRAEPNPFAPPGR